MEQYPVLQNMVRNEPFLEECQSGTANAHFVDLLSTMERSTCLFTNPELIDEELFQVNPLAPRHTQSLFHDPDLFSTRLDRNRKNSTGSMEEAIVLTDFKSYIQKLSRQQMTVPSPMKELSVRRKRIVKRTGRGTALLHRSALSLRADKGSRIVIRRNGRRLESRATAPRQCREVHSKNSTEHSLDDKLSAEQRTHALLSEHERMCHKAAKVSKFWKGSSLMIPNVFRITSQLEGSEGQVLEYQDLSRKEVLAQNGGFKATKESRETSKRSTCETTVGLRTLLN